VVFSGAAKPPLTHARRILTLGLIILLLGGYALPVRGDPAESGSATRSDSPTAAARPAAAGESGESVPDNAEQADEARRFRLLPVPIFITEPAIGEGLGVALALFHPVKQGKAGGAPVATPESIHEMSESREAPPVVTALVGAYTNNDTWMAGVGHFNNWRKDSIRYAGGLAKARVNSQIYLANLPLRFSMEAGMVFQELKFRLGHSDFMVGGGVMWMDADNRFGFLPPGDGEDDRFRLDFSNVGLELKLSYETRDNTMNPTRGRLAELALWRYDQGFGGDYDYWSWKARALSFHPLSDQWTLGLRLGVSGVDGIPPFFAFPFVKLRGIPALRYQDQVAGAAEAEARYLLAPRWEVSAFAGLGYVSDRIPLFDNPGSIYNFGVGGRYKVFDAHNVWMGVDIARGPEAWNWYIQVGHPW
jgi:hypothetical protein